MTDPPTRARWNRADWLVFLAELEWCAADTARILAETDALLAEIAASREERERRRLELVAVVVGPDGPRWE